MDEKGAASESFRSAGVEGESKAHGWIAFVMTVSAYVSSWIREMPTIFSSNYDSY